MTEHDREGVVFRTADAFTEAGGVIHGFSTRFGGVSDGIWTSMNLGTTRGDDPDRVRENYRRFFGAVGANLDGVVMSNQVHGTEIRVATTADIKKDLYDPEGYEVDGLMTDVPGLALVIFSADCLPVLLYDPVKKAVCAVHGGWRGTVAGIAPKAVRQLGEVYGSRPEDILATEEKAKQLSALSGLPLTAEEYMAAAEATTVEEVAAVARTLKLHTVFFLKGVSA
jgi:copper oxidase (laccase) domain-containing protein